MCISVHHVNMRESSWWTPYIHSRLRWPPGVLTFEFQKPLHTELPDTNTIFSTRMYFMIKYVTGFLTLITSKFNYMSMCESSRWTPYIHFRLQWSSGVLTFEFQKLLHTEFPDTNTQFSTRRYFMIKYVTGFLTLITYKFLHKCVLWPCVCPAAQTPKTGAVVINMGLP